MMVKEKFSVTNTYIFATQFAYFKVFSFLFLTLYATIFTYAQETVKVAFLADVHFMDVRGSFDDIGYQGIKTSKGDNAIIRTMASQLRSTRLFNENYFAFKSALDEIVKRNIKWVALPGDFSDDGQPFNISGLKALLDDYHQKWGIEFFMITGNHDPTLPFGKVGGKTDFLSDHGKSRPIFSENLDHNSNETSENPLLISDAVREMGYEEIIVALKNHGFYPKQNHLFWATPFCNYSYGTYTFSKAMEAAKLENRTYIFNTTKTQIPDVSYIVEPVQGLWLLAIDANIHLPKPDGEGFSSAGIGYNRVIEHKKHLISWIRHMTAEAKKNDKTIIAFSHYPVVDFNDGASTEIKDLFGEKSFQTHRNPSTKVAQILAEAGIQIHVGGHMHLNDTGVFKQGAAFLVNIQTPSLAGYPPAFKVLEIHKTDSIAVETVLVDDVPEFDSFFPEYGMEHGHLEKNKLPEIWNKKILNSKNYHEYTVQHLEYLVKLRFLPNEWPNDLKKLLLQSNGLELLALAHFEIPVNFLEIEKILSQNLYDQNWRIALSKAKNQLEIQKLNPADFIKTAGLELIQELYRLRNGDQLAANNLSTKKLEHYRFLMNCLKKNQNPGLKQLKLFAIIFDKQLSGDPSVNFSIDLNRKSLQAAELSKPQ